MSNVKDNIESSPSSNNFIEISISPYKKIKSIFYKSESKVNHNLTKEEIIKGKEKQEEKQEEKQHEKQDEKQEEKQEIYLFKNYEKLNVKKPKQSEKGILENDDKESEGELYRDMNIYEICEEISLNKIDYLSELTSYLNYNGENSQTNFADNENELINHLSQNEENLLNDKTEKYDKDYIDKQIELDREEYLINKFEEIKTKFYILDEKIVCQKCYSVLILEDILNNDECQFCLNIKNEKYNQKNKIKHNEKIKEEMDNLANDFIVNENSKNNLKEKFFSINEEEIGLYKEKDQIKSKSEIYYSESSYDSESYEEEIGSIKEPKYKFYIDKDDLQTLSKKGTKIGDIVNEKKWKRNKNNYMIDILNIKMKKISSRKKEEEYFVNYIKKKYSKNYEIEENVNSITEKADNMKLYNKYNENKIKNPNSEFNKYAYNEGEILDCSSNHDKKSNSDNSDFTFKKKFNNININHSKNTGNQNCESFKISSFDKKSSKNNINFNKNQKKYFDNLNIPELKNNLNIINKNKISFDFYPKNIKDNVLFNFSKYKKENDNKLLKKILKISKLKEIRRKRQLSQEENPTSYNIKSETMKIIVNSFIKEKVKKKRLDKKDKENLIISKITNLCEKKIEKSKNFLKKDKHKNKINEGIQNKLYLTNKESDMILKEKTRFCCCRSVDDKEKNECLIF